MTRDQILKRVEVLIRNFTLSHWTWGVMTGWKMGLILLHLFLRIIIFWPLPTGIVAMILKWNSCGGILAPWYFRGNIYINRSVSASQDPTKMNYYAKIALVKIQLTTIASEAGCSDKILSIHCPKAARKSATSSSSTSSSMFEKDLTCVKRFLFPWALAFNPHNHIWGLILSPIWYLEHQDSERWIKQFAFSHPGYK